MNIDYTIQIWKEGDAYVAHAMPVDVMSSGDTPEAARAAVDEAVELFLRTAAHAGTLGEVLEEAGYESDQGGWAAPQWVGIERHSLKVAV